MSLSMYEASVPVFHRALTNLAAILHKAATHAQAKKFDPVVLVNARLAPDMLPLSRQIQIASDHARGAAARLAGLERPPVPDNEMTLDDLQARIASTIAYLDTLKPAQIDGSEQREITLPLRTGEIKLKGQPYLLYFAFPNFWFHVTTAYAILRHNGVDIGKQDFIGSLPT
ncbi:MAG: DUF1993 family protein [Lysobacterales bacterium]